MRIPKVHLVTVPACIMVTALILFSATRLFNDYRGRETKPYPSSLLSLQPAVSVDADSASAIEQRNVQRIADEFIAFTTGETGKEARSLIQEVIKETPGRHLLDIQKDILSKAQDLYETQFQSDAQRIFDFAISKRWPSAYSDYSLALEIREKDKEAVLIEYQRFCEQGVYGPYRKVYDDLVEFCIRLNRFKFHHPEASCFDTFHPHFAISNLHPEANPFALVFCLAWDGKAERALDLFSETERNLPNGYHISPIQGYRPPSNLPPLIKPDTAPPLQLLYYQLMVFIQTDQPQERQKAVVNQIRSFYPSKEKSLVADLARLLPVFENQEARFQQMQDWVTFAESLLPASPETASDRPE
ncbi:MAG: hypothetical protein RBU29_14305 [bacterium]|nr:hypothetical protein [bacterium]